MRNNTLVIATLIYSISIYAQNISIQWDKTIGGNSNDEFSNLILNSNGGYLLGGYSISNSSGDKSEDSNGETDFWIVNLDADGNVIWDNTYGGEAIDVLTSMTSTMDNGYMLGGYSGSQKSGDKSENSSGFNDYWIVKTDAAGNKIWDKTFGGTNNDYLASVISLSDGGFLIGGHSRSTISGEKSQVNRGSEDYWIVKIDSDGNKIWDQTFGGNSIEILTAIDTVAEGGFILAGYSSSDVSGDKSETNKGSFDYWVVRLDANGNRIWDRTFGSSGNDKLQSIVKTGDGGYILAGSSNGNISEDKSENANGSDDFWVIKINSNGNKIWDKTIGGNSSDQLNSIISAMDGGYILGGTSDSNRSGDKGEASRGFGDYWIVKIDAVGNKIWDKTIGGDAVDRFHSLARIGFNDYIAGGDSHSNISDEKSEESKGGNDYWIVKFVDESPQITNYVLVNAETNEDIMEIQGGIEINLPDLPTTALSIRADGTGSIGSVQLSLSGSVTHSRIENIAPFTLYGDTSGNYNGTSFVPGVYNLSGTPYTNSDLMGTSGIPLEVQFSIVNRELQRAFVTTWKTNNAGTTQDNQINIPTYPGEMYDYSVDWGDGTKDTGVPGDITHTYSTPGTYTVSISGDFPRIFHNASGDAKKLISIDQWGTVRWTSMQDAFNGCTNLELKTQDIPNLSRVSNVSRMFALCSSLTTNPSMNNWDVSTITDMSSMFSGASAFNQNVGGWDVSNVTLMPYMFQHCAAFNQDITNWNVSNVTTMLFMFDGAITFNQNIGNWDVSKVQNMIAMFQNAQNFNQDTGNWDVSNVTNMSMMFGGAYYFNQDIGSWDVGNVSSMRSMFNGALFFDQNLGDWNIQNVTDMQFMFVDSGLSNKNYDNLLNGWASLPVIQNSVDFNGGKSQYCEGAEARQKLMDMYGWTITDGGISCVLENSIIDFILVDSESNQDLQILENDGVYDINEVYAGLLLNIRANTYPAEVGSVAFYLTGAMNTSKIENAAPYALYGDSAGNYNGVSFLPGSYTLTATPYGETSAMGEMGTPKSIQFTLAFRPMAVAEADIDVGTVLDEINFTGSSSTDANGNNDLAYSWNFGDGSSSTEVDPTHTFQIEGEYTVELTVTNDFGLSDTTTLTITIEDRELKPPSASMSFTGITSLTGAAPYEVGFVGTGSQDDIGIVNYHWDFGDGNSSTGEITEHVFETPGEFIVTLTVTDTDGLIDSATIPFTIKEPGLVPPQVMVLTGTQYGVAPFAINFDSSGSTSENGILSYLWDFGDGTFSSEANPTHVYATPGEYIAYLTIIDNIGLQGESSRYGIRVANPADDIYYLIWVNSDNDVDIFDIVDNSGIGLIFNNNNLSIRADINETNVESVEFELTGPISTTRVENVAPYALFGDTRGNYVGAFFPEGAYTLTATAYSGLNATGTQGQSKTVQFTVTDYSYPGTGKETVYIPKAISNEITLFPNMASDQVNISVSNPSMKIKEISVYDMTGRKVLQFKVSDVFNGVGYELGIDELPAGMYLIQTIDEAGEMHRKLLGIRK